METVQVHSQVSCDYEIDGTSFRLVMTITNPPWAAPWHPNAEETARWESPWFTMEELNESLRRFNFPLISPDTPLLGPFVGIMQELIRNDDDDDDYDDE